MRNERRLMTRAMWLATVLFAAGMFSRPGGVRSEEGIAKSSAKQEPTAPAFNPATLFRETEESLRPPPPEKIREWAGALLDVGQPPNAARQMLDRGAGKTDPVSFARDLVSRAQYPTAADLLEPLLRRSEDPEVALLQIACRLGLGQPDLARRPLILLESIRGPKAKEYAPIVAFVERLVHMASGGGATTLETNPWNVKFLPDKSGTPSKPLPVDEAKKLPADAELVLARWLKLAPMQPTVWALLGQILYVRGDPTDSLECFKRAKAMGYNSPIIAEYIRLLEREESARRAAVFKQMAGVGPIAPAASADDVAPAPVAMTGSSSRAFIAVGAGGLLVGFLAGLMAARRKP
jgi:hypothetical protein